MLTRVISNNVQVTQFDFKNSYLYLKDYKIIHTIYDIYSSYTNVEKIKYYNFLILFSFHSLTCLRLSWSLELSAVSSSLKYVQFIPINSIDLKFVNIKRKS